MPEKTVPSTVESKVAEREKTRGEERYLTPPVDIYETKEGLIVTADMPGVEKDGLELGLDSDVLTIKGTVQYSIPGRPIFSEFKLSNYFRQFQITEGIDRAKITAGLNNGVLTVNLPKAEELKPKQIPITAA